MKDTTATNGHWTKDDRFTLCGEPVTSGALHSAEDCAECLESLPMARLGVWYRFTTPGIVSVVDERSR